MNSPLTRPHIEIRSLLAVDPDPDGRPRQILVLGVSDSDSHRIDVSLLEHDAHGPARFVDPARSFTYGVAARFAVDALLGNEQPPPTFVWQAEFVVGSHPGLGLIRVGPQAPPVAVHARDLVPPGEDSSEAQRSFDHLPAKPGFDVGVLMVHGIGAQRSTDTLRQWSTAVQRWINVFFDAATTSIAGRLDLRALRHWESSIRIRPSLWSIDEGYVERCRLATRVVRAAESRPEARHSDADLHEKAVRLLDELAGRDLTAQERAGRDAVIRANEDSVHAAAFAGSAAFTAASLLDPGRSPSEPANAAVRIEAIAPDGYLLRSQWLLAEAHWAETFRAPDFVEFGRWAVRAGPIAFIYYFGMRVRRTRRPWFASAHLLLPLALAFAVLEGLLLLLLAVAAIPIPWVRRQVSSLERAMTGVLGDGYVFVTDDLQRRAILERVRRDLRWLLARCRKVVVVCHSQGAAITRTALEGTTEGRSPQLDSIVSLGAGLKILDTLVEYLHDPRAMRAGWAAIGGAVALVAGAAFGFGSGVGAPILLTGLVALVYGGVKAAELLAGDPLFPPNVGMVGHWHDYYAAHDPVPFGPIVDENKPSYTSHRVYNRDSVVSDHTTYWENADEFVGPLARHLAKAAGFAPVASLLPDDAEVLERAGALRAARVRALVITRWVLGACAVALSVAFSLEIAQAASWAAAWLMSRFSADAPETALPAAILGSALPPIFPILAYLAVLVPLWRVWGSRELAAVIRRDANARRTGWFAVHVFSTAAAVAISTALAVWLSG